MNNQTRLILGRGRRRKKERKQGTGNEIDRFLLKEYTTTSFEDTLLRPAIKSTLT
jgi:hypothetical protein